MTAQISGSLAVIKQLLPDGCPEVVYPEGVMWGMTSKESTLEGAPWRIPIMNEDTQGAGVTVADALAGLAQTSLVQFTVQNNSAEPYEYFSLARIKGSALKLAAKNAAGVVDLWEQQIDSASRTCTRRLAIHQYLNGTGVIGRISAASNVATTSITLNVIQDVAAFSIGSRLQFSTSGTLRAAGAAATVTGIDRAAGTLTFGSALSTLVPGVAASDDINFAGDLAKVHVGLGGWIVGGAAPGTLYGLNRNTDPARLSGVSYPGTSVPMTEALADLVANVEHEGKVGKTFFNHPKKFAKFLKLLEGKVVYQRVSVPGKMAGVGFDGIQFDSVAGPIKMLSDRHCPYKTGFMPDLDAFKYKSTGPIVQVLDFDSNEFIRVANDDAYEIRMGSYHLYGCTNTANQGKITNWGE